MAPKWSNKNLPGALHFVTGSFADKRPVFNRANACQSFVDVCANLKQEWPFKLIAYVLMRDHIHLIVNPRDGRIRELMGKLKSLSAREIIAALPDQSFVKNPGELSEPAFQVWQESFKAFPLWSEWMIWQKINYIHFNPVKAGLVKSASEYRWSSFAAFYSGGDDPMGVDRDWWWPDDVKKLGVAAAELDEDMMAEIKRKKKSPVINRK
jgi:putative transposase